MTLRDRLAGSWNSESRCAHRNRTQYALPIQAVRWLVAGVIKLTRQAMPGVKGRAMAVTMKQLMKTREGPKETHDEVGGQSEGSRGPLTTLTRVVFGFWSGGKACEWPKPPRRP